MFPIASLSRLEKVPLVVLSFNFTLLSVAATGRSIGSSTMPDKTNIPSAEAWNERKFKQCILFYVSSNKN